MLKLIILLLLQAPVQGEKKADPKPVQLQQIALSAQEQQQLTQAAQVVQSRDGDFKRALNAIADCPLEPDKTLEVVAKVQTAMARSEAAQAAFDRLVATFQARHSCPECRLTPDGKALSKPSEENKK